ncbi:hypothetical protein F4861DRAFT_426914 [Xylaria intraflava]|nr:hypothetical protein F4861DRAFT_426914 [Xylaria intraflava]
MTIPTTRLLARTTSRIASASIQCSQQSRSFSRTCLRRQDEQPPTSSPSLLSLLGASAQARQSNSSPYRLNPNRATPTPAPAPPAGGMSDVQRVLATSVVSRAMGTPQDSLLDDSELRDEGWGPSYEPFHFHIYSHRHNTHVTVTMPNRNPILSMSAGNIGFKKSKRGSYDAAYQLCAHVLDKLNQNGWHRKITGLEVVLSGFGNGREAATKVLLGNEGRQMRPLIRKVSDGTKLKFGGTRSPNPRRLG